MRVFLIWTEKVRSPELAKLILELKRHSHEVVYWVGNPNSEQDKLPETIFHSYIEAMSARPAKGLDITEFPPPGASIISQLYRVESIVLSMMNRLFDGLCVDERRHIYYRMLRYWLGVIKKYQPELIIFPDTPHFVFDYIIYELASLLNVKTIAFDDTRIPGRLLFFNDFWKGSETFYRALKNNDGKNFSLADLSGDLSDYYRPRADKNYKATPAYIQDQKKKYSTIHWLLTEPKIKESIRDLTIFKKLFVYFFKSLRQRNFEILKKPLRHLAYIFKQNLKKEYLAVQSKPDLTKKFIYAPIQSQPERTTSPQGDMFVDQILMLEILSAALPDDWIIYAKEHPIQWLRSGLDFSSFRYQGYYEKIAKIKNVRLIPVNANSYELIDKSQAVAVVTGSAGWEAILRSKPAIIFGHVWYDNCPGILKASDVESCQTALKKIIDGFSVDQRKIINYLKSFDQATIRGFISPTAGQTAGLTKQESMANITCLILDQIKKY